MLKRILGSTLQSFSMGDQDWDSVAWDKRGERGAGVSKTQFVNQAARKGELAQEKKYGAGGNVQVGTTKNLATLEDSDNLKVEKISMEFKKLLMQERTKAGITQKELATACNIKANIIQDYEAGKGVPNSILISKIEQAMKTKNPAFVKGTLSKAQKKAAEVEKAKNAVAKSVAKSAASTKAAVAGPPARSRRF